MRLVVNISFLNRIKTIFVFIFILILTFLSGYIIFQLLPNINNNFITFNFQNNRPIKILFSQQTEKILASLGYNPIDYKNNINKHNNSNNPP